MVETGQLPSCPRIEMRRPCISSSQTLSTVPALPSARITALPTSSVWARVNSPRIVHARSMMVFHKSEGSFGGGLSLKDVEVVTSARQRYVDGTASHAIWKLLAALNCRSCRPVLLRSARHTRHQTFICRDRRFCGFARSASAATHSPQSPWGDRQQVGGSGVAPKAPSAGAAPLLGISARSARCPSHEDGAPSVRRQRE